MDPEATLAIVRSITGQLLDEDTYLTPGQRQVLGGRLAEAVADLDGWLTGGGFLPPQWHQAAAARFEQVYPQ